jgi:MFS family permease
MDSRHSSSRASVQRYRWLVLAVSMVAQASNAALVVGIAVLAPAFRVRYGLTVRQVGLLVAAVNLGMAPTLLTWGLIADRRGERRVIGVGLTACAAALAAAAFASAFWMLVLALLLAGAVGSGVIVASGRAVATWLPGAGSASRSGSARPASLWARSPPRWPCRISSPQVASEQGCSRSRALRLCAA